MGKVIYLDKDHPIYALSNCRAEESYNDESETLDMLFAREFELKGVLERELSQEHKRIFEDLYKVIVEVSKVKTENAYVCGVKDGFNLKQLLKKT